jgi:DNA-binding MarR family transcriptional regulator
VNRGLAPLAETFSTAELAKSASRKASARSRSLEEWRALFETEHTLSWMFFDIHRLLAKDFETRAKSFGLTRAQWRVLGTIQRTEGGVNQTKLADLVEMEKAPLGKILDRLEESGWIVRKPHPTDRRARLVYATSKIEKCADQLGAAIAATFARMLQGVRQNEVKDLIARLEKLKRNLGGADDE